MTSSPSIQRAAASRSRAPALLLLAVLALAAAVGAQAGSLEASGIPAGSRVQGGSTHTLTLTLSQPVDVSSSVTVDVSCTNSGTPNPDVLSFAPGDTVKTTQYTAPSSAVDVTCTFTARTMGDDAFADQTTTLSFSIAPSLTVSGIAPGTELIAGSTHTLTLTASPAVANGAITVTSTCTLSPASFVLENDATTVEVTYTAPDSSRDAASCNFNLVPGGDPNFAGTNVNSISFSVLKPELTFTGVTNGAALLTGTRSNLTVTANAPIDGELRLTVICMEVVAPGSPNNIVLSDTVIVAAGETTGFVPLTAPLQPMSAGVECKVFQQSGDSRFNNAAVTNAVPTITFTTVLPTVTLNGLTEGAQVQAGSTQQITLTVSDAIIDIDDLSVNVTCPGTAVSGYFRVHTGTTLSTVTRVVVPVNATVGTTFTCTFKYLRGDIRYTNAAMPTPVSFSVAPVPVIEPSSSSSTGGGDSASSTAGGPVDGSSAGDASGSSTADAAAGSSSSTGSASGSSTAAGSSSSTGSASGSGSSTGSTTGSSSSGSVDSSSGDHSGLSSTAVPCVDTECAATAQAASGFFYLALAMAVAAALRS